MFIFDKQRNEKTVFFNAYLQIECGYKISAKDEELDIFEYTYFYLFLKPKNRKEYDK